MERCKEEEKGTFPDEINGLRKLLHQEFEQIKSKIISIEAVSVFLVLLVLPRAPKWRTMAAQLQCTRTSEENILALSDLKRTRHLCKTPPFSSEEDDDDESGEDSAYITSSRDKPSTSVHLTSTKEQQRAEHEFSWSDSNDSDESDTQKPHAHLPSLFSLVSNAVQTLARSLEKQLSITKKPVGGIRVLPPASQPSPRPSIIKQQAVSDEESDLDLSSIEELAVPPTTGRRSSDVAVTSGTSVWSSAASRAGAW
ncbi:hypothetical protein Q7C36_005993 [Tachysurus vachellii]|uniref:Uncharacterized protein n=1 Tax=Tachysurus vachellii TaxID=175792 RepID=A0AA88T8J4_TACVA|nr:hypothetical protein Q7C36_005993 [Tachysurus vachellii]